MLNSKSMTGSRLGFTLPEVLVAVAMVGVLSAVVLPSLVGQIGKSEISRVVTDIQSIEQASQVFRSDVGSWPGNVGDLVVAPAEGDESAIDGDTYGPNVSQWDGPYLSRADDISLGLSTGAGGVIAVIEGTEWTIDSTDDDVFFTVKVTGLTEEEARLVSLTVDGTEPSIDALTSGKVRYATSTGADTLTYFGAPLK